MKTTRNALLALLLLAAGTVTAASAQVSIGAGIHIGPSGRASVDLGFFYDNLASYGNWIQRPNYGWVWTPADVSTSWRPYEDGHWVWTDQGWTWITDEPYGWATYHYGRWYQDPEIGWAWVPGDEWGPAWVSWQEGGDYVGWAPLPPGVDISASYDSGYGYGYNGGYASYDYGIGPDAYVFVPERNFLSLSIASYVVPTVQVRSFWGQTRNYTRYQHEGGRIYNQGIPVDRVQRVIGRSVPRYQIADLQTSDYRQPRARISGNQVQIFRPQVQRTADVAPPVSRPAARRAVVSAEQFQANHPNRATRASRCMAPSRPTAGSSASSRAPSLDRCRPTSRASRGPTSSRRIRTSTRAAASGRWTRTTPSRTSISSSAATTTSSAISSRTRIRTIRSVLRGPSIRSRTASASTTTTSSRTRTAATGRRGRSSNSRPRSPRGITTVRPAVSRTTSRTTATARAASSGTRTGSATATGTGTAIRTRTRTTTVRPSANPP